MIDLDDVKKVSQERKKIDEGYLNALTNKNKTKRISK